VAAKSGKSQGNGLSLRNVKESKGIRLMLKTIREVSGKMFMLVASVNQFPSTLEEKSQEIELCPC